MQVRFFTSEKGFFYSFNEAVEKVQTFTHRAVNQSKYQGRVADDIGVYVMVRYKHIDTRPRFSPLTWRNCCMAVASRRSRLYSAICGTTGGSIVSRYAAKPRLMGSGSAIAWCNTSRSWPTTGTWRGNEVIHEAATNARS